MGLFSYLAARGDIKKIQGLIDSIAQDFNYVASLEFRTLDSLSEYEKGSFELTLGHIVSEVEEIDNICSCGNTKELLSEGYVNSFKWTPHKQDIRNILKQALERVIKYRDKLQTPPVYQEEDFLFTKYCR